MPVSCFPYGGVVACVVTAPRIEPVVAPPPCCLSNESASSPHSLRVCLHACCAVHVVWLSPCRPAPLPSCCVRLVSIIPVLIVFGIIGFAYSSFVVTYVGHVISEAQVRVVVARGLPCSATTAADVVDVLAGPILCASGCGRGSGAHCASGVASVVIRSSGGHTSWGASHVAAFAMCLPCMWMTQLCVAASSCHVGTSNNTTST